MSKGVGGRSAALREVSSSKVAHPDEDQVFVRMLSGDADADLPSALAVPAIQAVPGFRCGSSWDGLAGPSGPSGPQGLPPPSTLSWEPRTSVWQPFTYLYNEDAPVTPSQNCVSSEGILAMLPGTRTRPLWMVGPGGLLLICLIIKSAPDSPSHFFFIPCLFSSSPKVLDSF